MMSERTPVVAKRAIRRTSMFSKAASATAGSVTPAAICGPRVLVSQQPRAYGHEANKVQAGSGDGRR